MGVGFLAYVIQHLRKEIIKDGLFKEFIKKINEPLELERLRNENKKFRKKIKNLKKEVE